MTRTTSANALALVLISVLLIGCAGGPPKDVVLRGDLIAADDINPNRDGRPSPVTVAIYQLKSPDAFMSLDFFNLYDASSGALAADQIQRIDMQVQPGQVLPLASEFDPETSHIGILAAFRDIDQAEWRAIVELPDKKLREKINPFSKRKLIVRVDSLSVSASVEKQ